MKIVCVILIAMAALQGCVKVIPPMADTSDAAKIIYTRMALNPGEFQALRMFDNPRFEMTERSGRLIEHGHFVKQSTSVYVPVGERKYFKASYVVSSYNNYGLNFECSAGMSFIPVQGATYTLTQRRSAKGCTIDLVDESGEVPASMENLGVLK